MTQEIVWVDPPARRAGVGPRPLSLTPGEVAVLAVLAEAGGRVVSRGELARRAGLSARSARRCDSVVVRLRQALGPGAVATVRGRGWRLAVPARVVGGPLGLDVAS